MGETVLGQRHNVYPCFRVKQRAKMTPLEGKTASKIDPPQSDNLTAS